MDGKGGCCIARYAGGGYYDMSKLDTIMLRFRPIAPKPSGSGSGSCSPPQEYSASVKTGRGKRKYVKDINSTSSNRKYSTSGGSRKRKTPSPEKVVTLPLLPEIPENKDSCVDQYVNFVKKEEKKGPIWLSFGNQESSSNYNGGEMFMHVPQFVGSWVRVESVSESIVGGWYGLGGTDEERLMNLDRGKYPGFVSDGLNRVTWVNKAYREMMGEGEVVVWLVVKEGVRLPENNSMVAFTCRVRVVRCGKEKSSMILPCDVWRMDGGGFAWRLDTEAALSLGR